MYYYSRNNLYQIIIRDYYSTLKTDFTYIYDIVEGIIRVMNKAPEKKDGKDGLPIPPYKLYNIGNNHPENLLDFVNILAEELIKAGVLPKDFNIKEHMKLVPISLNVFINTTASILFLIKNNNIFWANTLCYYALICSSLNIVYYFFLSINFAFRNLVQCK